jgi:thioredoxin-dependent peroxiredoxin
MSVRLEIGDAAPTFTLHDQDDNLVSLADFRGTQVIVYFYPQAATPGCTTQACDFRDSFASLAAAGYTVLGISKDEIGPIKKFHTDEGLTFPLLSDVDLAVHNAYGAYGEKNLYGKLVTGTLRSTFVIDGSGTIVEALYNVKATGHVASLRKKLGVDAA